MQMPRLPYDQARGHALFPIFSMLAHNCMANCRYVARYDGRFVTVRALRHIQKGERLNIDYNDVLLGNLVRYLLVQSLKKIYIIKETKLIFNVYFMQLSRKSPVSICYVFLPKKLIC